MKNILIILILFSSGCATKWTPAQKKLLAASWLATGADVYTAEKVLDNPENHERYPTLGKHPSDTKLITFALSSQIGTTILAHFMPKWRSWLLGGKTIINTGCAINNSQLED